MKITQSAALVTGGASGLGAATAKALTESGAFVTIIDLNDEAADELVATLGSTATYVHADVTDPDAVAHAVSVAAETAPLRVAVNCAGVAIGERSIDRDGNPASLEAFGRVVTINLLGTYNVATQAAAAIATTAELEHGERGVIINTASVAAFDGQIGQTAYSASKGGVVGMTLPMARDLSSVGIRVNTIAPGIIDTPLLGSLNEDIRDALAANVPFPKRLGTPDDYANLAMAIIDNGYMNGETIRMDGSLRMAPK
ncbi:MAG: SDR family NAD(P)-dependent oxidoreductase [Acidimicrobiia bacterium]